MRFSMAEQFPKQFGKYLLLKSLARGGMGDLASLFPGGPGQISTRIPGRPDQVGAGLAGGVDQLSGGVLPCGRSVLVFRHVGSRLVGVCGIELVGEVRRGVTRGSRCHACGGARAGFRTRGAAGEREVDRRGRR